MNKKRNNEECLGRVSIEHRNTNHLKMLSIARDPN